MNDKEIQERAAYIRQNGSIDGFKPSEEGAGSETEGKDAPSGEGQPSGQPSGESKEGQPTGEPSGEQPKGESEEPSGEQPEKIDLKQLLSEKTDGKIKDEQELTEFLKKLDQRESEYAELLSKVSKLEQDADVSPFANPFSEKLNELIKGGATSTQIEAFIHVNGVDFDSLNPVELKKLRLKVENGFDDAEAERFITRQYGLDSDDDDEVADGKLKLKAEVKDNKEFLGSYKAEMSEPPANRSEKEARAKQEAYLADVRKIAPKLQTNFSLDDLSLTDGDNAITFTPKVPDEFKKAIPGLVEQYMVGNKVALNDKGIEDVNGFLRGVLWAEYGPQYAKSIAKHVESIVKEREVNRHSNAGGREKDNAPDSKGGTPIQKYKQKTLKGAEPIFG